MRACAFDLVAGASARVRELIESFINNFLFINNSKQSQVFDVIVYYVKHLPCQTCHTCETCMGYLCSNCYYWVDASFSIYLLLST